MIAFIRFKTRQAALKSSLEFERKEKERIEDSIQPVPFLFDYSVIVFHENINLAVIPTLTTGGVTGQVNAWHGTEH